MLNPLIFLNLRRPSLPHLEGTCKELRAQRSDAGGHQHPSWEMHVNKELKAQRPEKGGHHGNTCRELRAQRPEKGGHHYRSWETSVEKGEIRKGQTSLPELGDKCKERRDSKRADITNLAGWENSEHRDPEAGRRHGDRKRADMLKIELNLGPQQ